MHRERARAVEHGRKGQRNDNHTKGEDGEKAGGHVGSMLEKMEAWLCAFIPLKQKSAIPYQYHGNWM